MNKSTSRLTKNSINLNGGKSADGLKSKYNSTISGGVSQISYQFGTKIAKLQERGNFYANKIEEECKKLHEVETEIDKAQQILNDRRREVMKKKRADGNDNNPKAMEHKVKSMYHRLGLLQTKQNESLAKNEEVKEQINQLRKEKCIFDSIYNELQEQMQEKKDKLKKILIQSKIAKQEIQTGEQKLVQFKEDAHLERSNYESQINSIFKVYDIENKEQTLQKRFGMTHNDVHQYGSHTDHPVTSNQFITQPEHELPPMSPEQKRQYNKDKEQKFQEREQAQLQELKKDVQEYENIFKKLRDETGKQDMNEIVKTLVTYEEENYSLFRYINGLREEFDDLETQKKQLNQEIEEQEQIPKQIHNDIQVKKFMVLKKNIKQTEEKKQKYLENQKMLLDQIEELKVNLPLMFEKLNCKSSTYVKEFQEQFNLQQMDESNMPQYLAVIERRAIDLLQLFTEINQQQSQQDEQKDQKQKAPLQKKDDLEHALVQMDEEIEDNNLKLQEYKKFGDIQFKEKNLLNSQQLADNAKGEIQKLIAGSEKTAKRKKHKLQ